jgi:hypothetical protein
MYCPCLAGGPLEALFALFEFQRVLPVLPGAAASKKGRLAHSLSIAESQIWDWLTPAKPQAVNCWMEAMELGTLSIHSVF